LPVGQWYDYWTGEKYDGGQTITMDVPLDRIPLFVKAGALLPLATPTLHTADPKSRELEVRVYGTAGEPFTLYEDDDTTYAYERGRFNRASLQWRDGKGAVTRSGNSDYPRYTVSQWTRVR
jgi:alpha-D-xyloside xylohydrolase